MPTFLLDDKEIEFQKGEKVLAAALRAGLEVPHYCYHPALEIVATCRMCLVDIVDMGNGRPVPKLQTACSTDAVQGMKVVTKNQKVKDGRELVMEFLLVNHPLDCPICDQSGECKLQDYSFEYGSGNSQMEYSKRVYGLRDIGTFVTLERNRCIHCTRCERFTTQVSGTNEFGIFNRGSQLTVDTFADRPMTHKFQGNMADICPVGCITEKEFRFKRRVWKLKKTNSVCTNCSTGCNITVEEDKNTVFRFKPRENQEVNKWWMCDEGRISYRALNNRKDRLLMPQIRQAGNVSNKSWEECFGHIQSVLKTLKPTPEQVIALTDTFATNEEMFLLRQLLASVFQSQQVIAPVQDWSEPKTKFWIDSLITNDKSPNRAGAVSLGLAVADKELQQRLAANPKVLIVLGNPLAEQNELRLKLLKSELIIWIGTLNNEWSETAQVILPGQNFAEKQGTFTNKLERVQKINTALRAPEYTKPQWQILAELATFLGKPLTFQSAADVFAQISSTQSRFSGLSFASVGELGQPLNPAGA